MSLISQTSFHQLLENLKTINQDLVQAIKMRNAESVNQLLDKRMIISQKTEELSKNLNLNERDLPEESQKLLKCVIEQDRGLLTSLDWEVQKLQSTFKQLQRKQNIF